MQPAVKLAYSRDAPATFELLDERFGVRVETMLAHWLDDEVLAARLRRPVLLAVARGEIVGRSPADLSEDWVFGEARREARALIGPEGIAGVIPVMRKPTAAPPPPAAAVADEFDYLDEDRPESSFRVPPRWIWFGAFMALIGGVAAYGYFRVADAPDQRVAAVRLVPSVPVLPEPAAGPLESRQAEPDRPSAERPAAPPTEPAPAAPQQQDLARPAADPEPSDAGPTELAAALPTFQAEPPPATAPRPAAAQPTVTAAVPPPPLPSLQALAPQEPERPPAGTEAVAPEPVDAAPSELATALRAPAAEPVAPPPSPGPVVPPLARLQAPPPPEQTLAVAVAPPGTAEVATALPAIQSNPPPVEPTSGPAAGDPAQVLPAGVTASARVFIHYSEGSPASAARAAKLARMLADRGFEVVDIRPVPFEIGQPSVRYFFDDNRTAADQVAELSSALPQLSGLAQRGPTDFTRYQPKPQPGTLEVWLPTG